MCSFFVCSKLSIKIGGIDLVKRVQDGVLQEVRTVTTMKTLDHRNIVELDIPGSSGNVLQDMGCDSSKIIFTGEMTGKDSRDALEKLKNQYDNNKPMEFSSSISTLADIDKVLIEELYIEQSAPSRARLDIELLSMNMCSQRNKIRSSNDKSSVSSQKDGSTFDTLVAIR